MSIINGIDLIGFMVNDPSRATAFYRDVLGLTPTEFDKEGRGTEFTLADGTTFGVWKDEGTQAPGAAVMFSVDDTRAAVVHFRSRGATLSDPMETPVCVMSFGEDPDGNPFVIHQRKVRD